MVPKKILLLVGGNNFNYADQILDLILKYKKNIKLIIFTKNCSKKIIQHVKKNTPNARYFKSNKPCKSIKNIALIRKETNIGFNIGFNYIVSKKILDIINIVNPHPSYLPFNKGCHHSFWSIMENTPAGAALHWMNEKIDAGNIISRRKIKIDSFSSAESIQIESEKLCIQLLKESIERILKTNIKSFKQKKGNYHAKEEIIKKTTLKANKKIDVEQLFKLIRATKNGKNGFYIEYKKEKIFIKIEKYELIK